jgi:hypothetical protein
MFRYVKISEVELVNNFRTFLISESLVNEKNSHFDGDDENRADVELVLDSERWSGIDFKKIYIEAKSHHSTDSQNTINKIFGQLLKETGKRSLDSQTECLAILFPSESAQWIDNKNKPVTKIIGVDYYRRGFSRINQKSFIDFGELVGAKYILSYNTDKKKLDIFKWATFLDSNVSPILSLQLSV